MKAKGSMLKIGDKFGRWTVTGPYTRKGQQYLYPCVCECGTKRMVGGSNLVFGKSLSCGCLPQEKKPRKYMDEVLKASHQKQIYDGTRVDMIGSRTPTTSTTGYKGVSYVPRLKKYRAYIFFRKRQYHLGTFASLEDAVQARKEAEEEIFQPVLEKYQSDPDVEKNHQDILKELKEKYGKT